MIKARRVSERSPIAGNGIGNRNKVDVGSLSKYFFNTYTRVLATFVCFQKADLLISRKSLIGLRPEQQNSSKSSSKTNKPFASFMRDYFGPEKGTHYYDTLASGRQHLV